MPNRPPHRRVLSAALRRCRSAAGLTQEKLAEKAGLHHNFIGEVERGNMNISLDALVKIARALGVKVHDLTADI